jgi:hypothetical protein
MPQVFEVYITNLGKRSQQLKRKTLLLMDNAPTHLMAGKDKLDMEGFVAYKVNRWLTVLFFPPNVTSIVQPMDQGIIAAFKARYKAKLLRWKLAEFRDDPTKDQRKVLPNVKQVCSGWGWLALSSAHTSTHSHTLAHSPSLCCPESRTQ